MIDRGRRNLLGVAINAVDYECAVAKIIWVASGVPKVGAPVRIEIAPTKDPRMTGAPGLTI